MNAQGRGRRLRQAGSKMCAWRQLLQAREASAVNEMTALREQLGLQT